MGQSSSRASPGPATASTSRTPLGPTTTARPTAASPARAREAQKKRSSLYGVVKRRSTRILRGGHGKKEKGKQREGVAASADTPENGEETAAGTAAEKGKARNLDDDPDAAGSEAEPPLPSPSPMPSSAPLPSHPPTPAPAEPAPTSESASGDSSAQEDVPSATGTLVLVQGVVTTTNEHSDPNPTTPPTNAETPEPSSEPARSDPATPERPLLPATASTPPAPAPTMPTSPALSQSSIDVLGTLLSVAAAATAASLLTGSSEPILSSGLDPSSAPPPAPEPPATSVESRRERMRQTWQSIRDRLGLPQSPPSPPSQNPQAPQQSTRDIMLAEMARAFGMGASSPTLSPPQSSSPTAPQAQSPQPSSGTRVIRQEMPPEGSFERFLIDLQSDLRRALASDPRPHQRIASVDTQSPDDEPAPASTVPEVAPSEALDTSHAAGPSSPSPRSSIETMPSLHSVTSSEASDFDTDMTPPTDEDGDGDEEPTEDMTPSSPPMSATTHREGRVNWWRMYRFPPVAAPPPSVNRGPGMAMSASPLQTNVASPPQTAPLPTSPPPPVPAEPAIQTTDEAQPSPSTSGTSNPSSVIPVIVVGLQSVRPPPNHPTPNSSRPAFAQTPPVSPTPDQSSPSLPSTPTPANVRPSTGNRMSWPSRSAPASHNPPHSPSTPTPHVGESMPRTPDDDQGSRTFLIYVIGGYYPPDHSIVTSGLGPGNLDSFEALLEIAELLGQAAKPPTATKEEIEKSGLGIVPASTLSSKGGEPDGVLENCVDQCLICLEEYSPEDPVRLMSCRHAFHKDCVDTWLETGRNNCPACRSQGVQTTSSDQEEPLSPHSPLVAAPSPSPPTTS